jgi:hypothetical protein
VSARHVAFAGHRPGWTALAVAVAGVGLLVLIGVRYAFRQDAWLALAAGREVWHHGIPHHDVMTALTAGREWIDQQWLAQLTLYGIFRVGGLALVALTYAALVVGSLAAAVVLGGRLGASARAQTWLFAPCALLVFLAPVRTQPLAYPLFIAVTYVLAVDSRTPSRRVYLTLPLLVVWANVHGSVTLGAALVALRGITLLLSPIAGVRARGAVLALAAPLCLLVTPYGLDTTTYYRATLFEHDFTRLVTEWRPVTSAAIAAIPFFILLAATAVSLSRARRRLTTWELIAVGLLFAAGAFALRNVVWLAFGLLLIPAVDVPDRGVEGTREGLRRAPVVIACAAAVVLSVVTMTRDDRYFEAGQSQGALRATLTELRRNPQLTVFADERYADWLVWRAPSLTGRVAFDVRFELLTRGQLDAIAHTLKRQGGDWKRGAEGYRLVVLTPGDRSASERGFLAEPGARILFRDADGLVVLRAPEEAG